MPNAPDVDRATFIKLHTTQVGRSVAKRIKDTRLARGYTQPYVEDMAGLSRGTLSRIESMKRAVATSVNLIVAIAFVLDVDVGWLITGVVPDGKWKPPMGVR